MALFGKSKKKVEKPDVPFRKSVSGETRKSAAQIGKNLVIKGTISGEDDVDFQGNLEGDCDMKGNLLIGPSAHIKGQVKAKNISVKGSLEGSITGLGKLHLDPSARIKGNLTAPKISMAEGSQFDGEIKMSGAGIASPKPRVINQTIPAPESPKEAESKAGESKGK